MEQTGLAISALLLLATAFSAASSSLSASLMACLMSSITRMPAANCWCGRRWSDCDGRSYRTTDTHPPCSLSPAVSGAGRAVFLNWICQMYFLTVFLSYRTDTDTQTHTHTLVSCLRAGRPGFFTLAQLSQVGSNLLWQTKTAAIHPWHVFSLLPFGAGDSGEDFWSNLVNKHQVSIMRRGRGSKQYRFNLEFSLILGNIERHLNSFCSKTLIFIFWVTL